MNLRVRMALAAGVAVAIAVVAVSIAAYAGTNTEVRGQLDQSLRSLTGRIIGVGGAGPGAQGGDHGGAGGAGSPPEHLDDRDEGLHLDADNGPAFGGAAGAVTLIHPDGFVFHPPAQLGTVPAGARAKALAASGHGRYFEDLTVNGTPIRVLATGIGPRGALLVALPMHDVDHTLDRLLVVLALIAAGGILFAAALGLLVARTALRPIARFTRQTETIAAHPDRLESARLDVHGGDELARLAQTFNRTLDALDRSVQSQRNLVADASHELRTPIASIRANLQLMRDEELLPEADREALRRDVIEELDELTALVGDVVELARGGRLSGEPAEVRVDQIVTAAVERTRRRAPQLTVSASVEPTLVRGEGDRIARAVANLLDNAAKYGQAGGLIEVTLAGGTLAVRDHGPGFHEEDLPFVFDRFHRARDARSQPGSGLGLAIVRQAAEAHGGSVRAANAPGGGALLEVGFGPTLEVEDAGLPDAVTQSSSGA
ncbi:MAG TPA: HAMP domain-containing sensor histidine kinase [Solirubrobacteraceae bacterium]|jgi:two-component system sensor histidine kinase MprB|nr:HAMP domain-containing sensor histidine kinase [Solirubrobacteraceae bacterium]